jgi:hypothetical protein
MVGSFRSTSLSSKAETTDVFLWRDGELTTLSRSCSSSVWSNPSSTNSYAPKHSWANRGVCGGSSSLGTKPARLAFVPEAFGSPSWPIVNFQTGNSTSRVLLLVRCPASLPCQRPRRPCWPLSLWAWTTGCRYPRCRARSEPCRALFELAWACLLGVHSVNCSDCPCYRSLQASSTRCRVLCAFGWGYHTNRTIIVENPLIMLSDAEFELILVARYGKYLRRKDVLAVNI